MNQQKNLPIGVFDSGVGGLTVAREIMRQMPNEKIVYFGDTARVPYGNKSSKTILKYSGQIERFLLSRGVKAIAVACNTASAYALPELEKDCPVPIIGVIKPGAKTAAEITENGRIGVIGTTATISSGIYTEYIRDLMPDVMVHGRACPLFVPLVEEGLWEDPVTEEIARRYLAEVRPLQRSSETGSGWSIRPMRRPGSWRKCWGAGACWPRKDRRWARRTASTPSLSAIWRTNSSSSPIPSSNMGFCLPRRSISRNTEKAPLSGRIL